jgi:peptidoglycan/xylan/chitin deacetylase (PgdA/CDA1 family)
MGERQAMAESIAQRTKFSRGASHPLVLMYHSITTYTEDPYQVTVSPDRFEQQLRWLRRQGLTGTSMRHLLHARSRGEGRNLVGLTFDDGYADFLDSALPLLTRYGCTATLFVIAGRLGGENVWDPLGPRKPLVTADQVRHAADAGVEIGSHGMWHQRLPDVTGEDLREEVETSRSLLRKISGQTVPGFCYPYGEISASVVDTVRSTEYDYGCAIWPSEHSGRHALPRTFVGEKDGPWRLHAKRFRHALRSQRDR